MILSSFWIFQKIQDGRYEINMASYDVIMIVVALTISEKKAAGILCPPPPPPCVEPAWKRPCEIR